jgi:hypothetical protein
MREVYTLIKEILFPSCEDITRNLRPRRGPSPEPDHNNNLI